MWLWQAQSPGVVGDELDRARGTDRHEHGGFGPLAGFGNPAAVAQFLLQLLHVHLIFELCESLAQCVDSVRELSDDVGKPPPAASVHSWWSFLSEPWKPRRYHLFHNRATGAGYTLDLKRQRPVIQQGQRRLLRVRIRLGKPQQVHSDLLDRVLGRLQLLLSGIRQPYPCLNRTGLRRCGRFLAVRQQWYRHQGDQDDSAVDQVQSWVARAPPAICAGGL